MHWCILNRLHNRLCLTIKYQHTVYKTTGGNIFLFAIFQLFDQTCHLAECHTSLPCSRRRKEGAVKPCACARGCFSLSLSLKVSWATGVSSSLTGDQLAERRMITASSAVIQPSHISMNCSQRSHWSCLLLFAGQRYWSVSKNCISFSYEIIFS